MKPFDREIVSGSVLRSVWKLSWPLVLLNLVNGMQGFVNHIMVGHYVISANSAANATIAIMPHKPMRIVRREACSIMACTGSDTTITCARRRSGIRASPKARANALVVG